MVESDDQSNSQRPFHSVEGNDTSEDRLNRLVDWNFESLLRLLRGVVARRMSKGEQPFAVVENLTVFKGDTFLDEVKEIIHLMEMRKLI